MNVQGVDKPVPMQLLLVEKVHHTFETWLIRQIRANLLPEDEPITIRQLRLEYLKLCWKEEVLWKKWSENVKE